MPRDVHHESKIVGEGLVGAARDRRQLLESDPREQLDRSKERSDLVDDLSAALDRGIERSLRHALEPGVHEWSDE